ncbi:MAG: ABC transporter C-terminal domain-containing protein, partial [Cyanobacteria bacterium P01_A01_bin.135]
PSKDQRVKPLSNYEQREYQKLEEAIAQMETKKAELEAELVKNAANFSVLEALTQQLTQISADIDAATEQWMTFAERDI